MFDFQQEPFINYVMSSWKSDSNCLKLQGESKSTFLHHVIVVFFEACHQYIYIYNIYIQYMYISKSSEDTLDHTRISCAAATGLRVPWHTCAVFHMSESEREVRSHWFRCSSFLFIVKSEFWYVLVSFRVSIVEIKIK